MVQIYTNIENPYLLRIGPKNPYLHCFICTYLHRITYICILSGIPLTSSNLFSNFRILQTSIHAGLRSTPQDLRIHPICLHAQQMVILMVTMAQRRTRVQGDSSLALFLSESVDH